MSIYTYTEAFCVLVLIGASGYGLYQLTPNTNPYAYTAAAFCMVHGFLALERLFDSEEECGKSFDVSANVTNIIPLPIANIEFYLASSKSEVALVHALSLILLIYDMMSCGGTSGDSGGDESDQKTETVKTLSIVGNIGSAVYLGISEENYFHAGIGAAAGVSRFGGALLNSLDINACNHMELLGKAAIVGLMTYALTSK